MCVLRIHWAQGLGTFFGQVWLEPPGTFRVALSLLEPMQQPQTGAYMWMPTMPLPQQQQPQQQQPQQQQQAPFTRQEGQEVCEHHDRQHPFVQLAKDEAL